MNSKIFVFLLAVNAFTVVKSYAQEAGDKKVDHDFELELEAEYRYFYDNAVFEGQSSQFPSIAIRPTYAAEWKDGYESIHFQGFFRYDRDDARTHGDIRELYYQKAKNSWELNLGIRKVYWGVAESNHLVDIINQTDQVESFDGEEKLGQPMAQFSWNSMKWGTFSFFYMPMHRKRTLPGEKGRLRFPVVLDKDDLTYESEAAEWRQDVAFRWNHYFGIFDVGVSHFYGNGREPIFFIDQEENLTAFYPVINQTGLDFQITHNAFLWKFESIYRHAKAQEFIALVAGLEYTFSNIDGNGLDIGLLSEYLYDERKDLALSGLQNDIFFGSRIAFNDIKDTSILLGGIVDLDRSSRSFAIEASRRIGSSWTTELEARMLNGISDEELILSNFRQDSFLRFSFSRYF